MIFFGRKASKIGEFDINNSRCDYCENTDTHRVTVFGKYAHIYWIPFFPIGKEAVAECVHCKRTIRRSEFPKQLTRQYREKMHLAKRPFWHWTGLSIIIALIMYAKIFGGTTETDYRNDLLQADIEQMVTNPTQELDSTSYRLKTFFDAFINEEIKPSEFEFLTKTKENKFLVLVRIPNLKKVKKESRKEVIELIETVINSMESIKEKDHYIGIHGKFSFMMIKTPTEYESRNFISASPLYEFYGPELPKKQE